jgi:glycosyltransferase involved in cell wall biosynthesis
MELVIISHASVVDVYQDKLRYIAAFPDVRVTLIVPEKYLEGSAVVEAYHGSGEYRVIALPTRFGEAGMQNLHWYRGIQHTLKEIQPDVIHLEEEPESVVTAQIVFHACRLPKKPKIVLFTWANISLAARLPYYSSIKRYILSRCEKYVLPRLHGIICGNKEAYDFFSRLLPAAKATLIPQFGINPEVYFPPQSKAQARQTLGLKQTLTIGYVGRMISMKSVHVFLEAAAKVKQHFHDQGQEVEQQLSIVLLGSGTEKQALQQQARELEIDDIVRFHEAVPQSKVPVFLQALDIMVLPSKTTEIWKEQFGRVLIEAMACGAVAVGSSSGAIPEVIGNPQCVFPEGDSAALADILITLCSNQEARESAMKCALRSVKENYTNQVVGTKMVKFFQSL